MKPPRSLLCFTRTARMPLVLAAAVFLPWRVLRGLYRRAAAWYRGRTARREAGLTFSEERALDNGVSLNSWFLREPGAPKEGKFR